MKGLFPQYRELQPADYATAWKQALFVFDTNVLLNLYRYQAVARDELISILQQLSARIWIPHHVALEFHRNRLRVIAEQIRRFSEVRRTVEKARLGLVGDLDKLQLRKRHALIDPTPLTAGFESLVKDFLSDIDRLQNAQQELTGSDPLRERIEDLFNDRVGAAPKTQNEIDVLYENASKRFKLLIPPGYEDANKEKGDNSSYSHDGIVYRKSYGDFLVWSQVLEHCKTSGVKAVVFVTDDAKEDWWQKVEVDGLRTIGPRVELIDEARGVAGVETFLMYNPEGFLKYAKEFLSAPVSEETLAEVRSVSTSRWTQPLRYREFLEVADRAEGAVLKWLQERFEDVDTPKTGFANFVVTREGRRIGFAVKFVHQPRSVLMRLRENVYRAYYELKEGHFDEFVLVWVVANPDQVDEATRLFGRLRDKGMPKNLRTIVGVYGDPDAGGPGFIPYYDASFSEMQRPTHVTQ